MPPANNDISPQFSALFHDDDADVTFVSSDNVAFEIHSIHLNSSTNIGLARSPQDTITSSEPPPPSRNYKQSSIPGLNPDLFFRVSETAEKYIIYGASRMCYDRMEQLASKYPCEVLNYSTLHGYAEIADKAAEYILTHPIEDVIPKLTAPGLLTRYLLYSNLCLEKTRDAARSLPSGQCPRLLSRYKAYREQLDKNPLSIYKVPTWAPDIECNYKGVWECICGEPFSFRGFKNAIPKFSSVTVP